VGQEALWLRAAETMNARAWRPADAGPESSWRCPLPPQSAGALLNLARALASGPAPLVETRVGG